MIVSSFLSNIEFLTTNELEIEVVVTLAERVAQICKNIMLTINNQVNNIRYVLLADDCLTGRLKILDNNDKGNFKTFAVVECNCDKANNCLIVKSFTQKLLCTISFHYKNDGNYLFDNKVIFIDKLNK